MNNHEKGFYRDKAILEAIEEHEVLNTDQITALFFNGMKNGKRMAQKRLKSLFERERVQKGRLSYYHPCHYHTTTRPPGQIEHRLGINWFYIWLNASLKNWERLHCFEHEQEFGILRADGLAAIKNTVTGQMRFIFLEMDRAESGNKFDKIEKYNQLYQEAERYADCWWVNLTDRFPAVYIVTTSNKKIKAIEKIIKEKNANNLEFRVLLLSDLVGECHG